jgi:hypothetical protein
MVAAEGEQAVAKGMRASQADEGAQAIARARRCMGGCKGTGWLLRRMGGRGA